MKNSILVSRIKGMIHSLNKDDRISPRLILNIAKSKANTYIAQKLGDRTLYREMNLYRTINCFELKKNSTVKCDIIQFRRCKKLMKSKCPLPELIYSKYGSSIFLVSSIEDGKEFTEITISDYINLQKREHAIKGNVYYIDGERYLWIPDSEVEAVNVRILSPQEKEVNDACGCNAEDKCKSVWEYEFICPDKLEEPIIRETLQEIATIYKAIVEDTNPDLDQNNKGKTTQ